MRTMVRSLVVFAGLIGSFASCFAQESLVRREWKVGDVVREGLLYAPADAREKPAPLVFVFHGHGGSMRNASRSFPIHQLWPEAISVYLQGLKTPGALTDPNGTRAGWQSRLGSEGDRDLKLFDIVLESLKKEYKVDTNRIYCTGHSNGGGFTYLLWSARPDVFAAVAPSSAVPAPGSRDLTPKPVFHVAREADPLVKFAWQKLTIDALIKRNGCDAQGQKWEGACTMYPSKGGTPVITYIHPGGHALPVACVPLIVKFFKAYPKRSS